MQKEAFGIFAMLLDYLSSLHVNLHAAYSALF